MEGVIDLDLLEDIKGFEGLYKINRKGQVWSVKSKKFMKLGCRINKRGKENVKESIYYIITLQKDKKSFTFYLHRLLALQFIPNPLGLPQVDHIDINGLNNCLNNLRWVTSRTNLNNRNYKSKTGEKNISFYGVKNYYRVTINVKIHRVYDKCFKTLEEAVSARDNFLRETNLN